MTTDEKTLLKALKQRVERLEAERDILQVLYAFGHAADAGDVQGWLGCFTDDGVFSARNPDPARAGILLQSRAEHAAFAGALSCRPHGFHQHGLIEPRITVDASGDTAVCDAYMFVFTRAPDDVPLLRSFGRYHDDLVKGGDGRWRIRRREVTLDASKVGLPPLSSYTGLAAPAR